MQLLSGKSRLPRKQDGFNSVHSVFQNLLPGGKSASALLRADGTTFSFIVSLLKGIIMKPNLTQVRAHIHIIWGYLDFMGPDFSSVIMFIQVICWSFVMMNEVYVIIGLSIAYTVCELTSSIFCLI